MSFVLMFVSDQYKSQEISNIIILEIGGLLKLVPDYNKNWKICDKAVDDYFHVLESVHDCYKNQKMYDETVNIYPSAIKFIPKYWRLKKCVIKMFILVLFNLNLFLIDIRLKNTW